MTHAKRLDQLASLLRRRPLTAREIADRMKCCKPAAYARVRALIERGDRVLEIRRTDRARRGPSPVAYWIEG